MKKASGFTVIELLLVLVVLAVGGWLFFSEKARVEAAQRDTQRKISINAMYYNLEEVFFEKNRYYPSSIDSKTLRAMDPELFNDPSEAKINAPGSDYHYQGKNCSTDGRCSAYELRATMEREADYVKKNRDS